MDGFSFFLKFTVGGSEFFILGLFPLNLFKLFLRIGKLYIGSCFVFLWPLYFVCFGGGGLGFIFWFVRQFVLFWVGLGCTMLFRLTGGFLFLFSGKRRI